MSTSLLSTFQTNIRKKNNKLYIVITIKYYNIFLYMALIYWLMVRAGDLFI